MKITSENGVKSHCLTSKSIPKMSKSHCEVGQVVKSKAGHKIGFRILTYSLTMGCYTHEKTSYFSDCVRKLGSLRFMQF